MKLLILGDSHTAALKRGVDQLEANGALDPSLSLSVYPLGTGARLSKPFWQPAAGYAAITDNKYSKKLDRVPPKGETCDAVGLSMPLWYARVMRAMLEQGLCLPGTGQGQVISNAVFRQMVLADQEHILGFIDHLLSVGLPVFAIETPGVFRDNRFIGRMGAQAVLAVHQTYTTIMRCELAKRGVAIVDVPPESRDDEGFTRVEHRHEDPTDAHHGNIGFGVMMIYGIEVWARDFAASKALRA
jgi:hypothetical protein